MKQVNPQVFGYIQDVVKASNAPFSEVKKLLISKGYIDENLNHTELPAIDLHGFFEELIELGYKVYDEVFLTNRNHY